MSKANEVYKAIRNYFRTVYCRHPSPAEDRIILSWIERSYGIVSTKEREKVDTTIFGDAADDYLKTLRRISTLCSRSVHEIQHYIEENQHRTIHKLYEDLRRLQDDLKIEKAAEPNSDASAPPTSAGAPSEAEKLAEVEKLAELMLKSTAEAEEREIRKEEAQANEKAEKEIQQNRERIDEIDAQMKATIEAMQASMNEQVAEIALSQQAALEAVEALREEVQSSVSKPGRKS